MEDKVRDFETLDKIEELKDQLTDYADGRLALAGYKPYIRHNLGAALTTVREGNVMYYLDDLAILKQALDMTIPLSLCGAIVGSTDQALTEYDGDGIRDLFIRYTETLSAKKADGTEDGECILPSRGVLEVKTPVGTLEASRQGLNGIRVALKEDDRLIATVSPGKVEVYNCGLTTKTIPLEHDLWGWENPDISDYSAKTSALFQRARGRESTLTIDTTELDRAKIRWIESVLPANLAVFGAKSFLPLAGEAYDAFSHGGNYVDVCRIAALEKLLGMDVPYWMYLALMVCSDGADPVTAKPSEIRFDIFAKMLMNEDAPGEATSPLSDRNSCCALVRQTIPSDSGKHPNGMTAWQVMNYYPAPATYYPGIYISSVEIVKDGPFKDEPFLYSDAKVLIEYQGYADEEDSEEVAVHPIPDADGEMLMERRACAGEEYEHKGEILVKIWAKGEYQEAATHTFTYRRRGTSMVFEAGNVLVIPGLHTNDYKEKVLSRDGDVLYCQEVEFPDSAPIERHIETDPTTGSERFLAWEYSGAKCYVYPDHAANEKES